MSSLHFSRWLALVGIIAGVGLAIGLPVAVLIYGQHLSTAAQLTVIILSLIAGAVLATASAVVGITIPTAILDGKLDLSRLSGAGTCCEKQPEPRRDNGAAGAAVRPA